jgi:L-threonylcarbamoyladenylate synthase
VKNTIVLRVDPKRPGKKEIAKAAKVLRRGGLVGFPTETVYGLGANLLDKKAIAKLYKVKRRPKAKPFTVHIENISSIKKLGCEITRPARALIDKYWPGPLTVILKCGKGKNIGFRMPDNIVALRLIKAARVPVVAPSANISNAVSPTTAEDVLAQMDGKIDILLDAGVTDVGIESTVVDMTVVPPRILRRGAIKEGELLRAMYG